MSALLVTAAAMVFAVPAAASEFPPATVQVEETDAGDEVTTRQAAERRQHAPASVLVGLVAVVMLLGDWIWDPVVRRRE